MLNLVSLRINNLLSVYFDIFTHYTGADICEFFYIEGIPRASVNLRNGQTARTSQNSSMVGCGYRSGMVNSKSFVDKDFL